MVLSRLFQKKGFTLVELTASLGIAGSVALVGAQESKFETSQVMASALGNEIFIHNSAVNRFLAANAGDATVAGSYTGTNWLKSTDCASGTADDNYLSCDALPDGRTIHFGIRPMTEVTVSADGDLSARTLWDTVIGEAGKSDSMVMGIAALSASGSYASEFSSGASGYQFPTVYCPDITTVDVSIAGVCGGDRDTIISTAGISGSIDPWLRTDHGNTMRHAIEFNEDGDRSTEADLRAEEDRAGNSWLRQIVNVSRIYSGKGASGESLTLGSRSGNAIYTDAFLTANNLLDGAVIMDGDVGVMNNIHVNLDAFINGNITGNGDITADSGVIRGGTVRSIADTIAGRDVLVNRYVSAQQYVDANDPSKFLDPDARSEVNHITASGDVRATRFYDQDNTSFYLDPAGTSRLSTVDASQLESRGEVTGGLFRDINNTGRYANPSARSEMESLTLNNTGSSALHVKGRIRTDNFLHLGKVVSKGGSCSPNGLVGRLSNGTLVSCVSGKWSGGSGGDLFTTMNRTKLSTGKTYTNNTGKPMMLTARGYTGSDARWKMSIYVDGKFILNFGRGDDAGGGYAYAGSVIVPPGSKYKVTKDTSLSYNTTRWY